MTAQEHLASLRACPITHGYPQHCPLIFIVYKIGAKR